MMGICERSVDDGPCRVTVTAKCWHEHFIDGITMPPLNFRFVAVLREFAEHLPVQDTDVTFSHPLFTGTFRLVSWAIEA